MLLEVCGEKAEQSNFLLKVFMYISYLCALIVGNKFHEVGLLDVSVCTEACWLCDNLCSRYSRSESWPVILTDVVVFFSPVVFQVRTLTSL
jgi:hypothetical protein